MKGSLLDERKTLLKKSTQNCGKLHRCVVFKNAGKTRDNRSVKLRVRDYAQNGSLVPEIVDCLLSRCRKRKKGGSVCVAKPEHHQMMAIGYNGRNVVNYLHNKMRKKVQTITQIHTWKIDTKHRYFLYSLILSCARFS